MHEEQDGYLTINGDPEKRIVALDGAALDEVSGGIPDIIVCPVPPVLVVGGLIDGVATGVKDVVNAALIITKLF